MKAKRERRRRKEEIRKNKEVEGKGDRRNKMAPFFLIDYNIVYYSRTIFRYVWVKLSINNAKTINRHNEALFLKIDYFPNY